MVVQTFSSNRRSLQRPLNDDGEPRWFRRWD